MTLLIVGLFVLLFTGFPIFLALLVPSAGYLSLELNLPAVMIQQRVVAGMNNFSLLAVPFFILAATVMGRGQLGKRLVSVMRAFMGHFYGGLAHTVTATCTVIGAISGAGTAGIVTVGPLVYDEMQKSKYSKGFSAGLITSASTLAMLVPPSIAGIIYAMNTGESIAKVFIACLVPGLLYGAAMMVYSYIYARKTKVPRQQRASAKELLKALKESGWALGLPVIILGGIYSGLFSPTEAAAVSAVYAILVELLVYKDTDLKTVFKLCVEAGITVAMLYLLISSGSSLAYSMSLARIPDMLAGAFTGFSPFVMLLIFNVCFLIAGMFIDVGSAIIILIPLFLPLARILGIDLIHLGTITVFNLSLGMLTPPFGLNLFVGSNVMKLPIGDLVKAIVPFLIMGLLVLLAVTYIPGISTFLPNLLF